MGVFRTKFVTENVEQYRETGEREGEAQNTTFLNVSFRVSSVPDFLDDGSRQFQIISFVEEVNAGFCGCSAQHVQIISASFAVKIGYDRRWRTAETKGRTQGKL